MILKRHLKDIVYDREQEAYAEGREVKTSSSPKNPF